MNESRYGVEVISQAEADAFLRQMACGGPENRGNRRTIVTADGFEISGEFFLTARDARSGEVEWEHHDKNLITDFGRRCWFETKWHQATIAFAPSTETPLTGRYSIPSDSAQTFSSAALSPSNNGVTHTKTFSTTYIAPGSNRTLATIVLGRYTGAVAMGNMGLAQVMAFALLTPPKTQTTTQTLEVVYKVSMNPIA
jgi:hypothetical protein